MRDLEDYEHERPQLFKDGFLPDPHIEYGQASQEQPPGWGLLGDNDCLQMLEPNKNCRYGQCRPTTGPAEKV